MKLIRKSYFVVVFIFILNSVFGNSYKKYADKAYSMGTFLEITFFSNQENGNEILKDCYKLADDLEKRVSCKLENSVISQLNKNKNAVINDDFVYNLLVESIKYSKETDGKFDPSLYHLIDIWGFESGKNKVPLEAEINDVLRKRGYKNVVLSDRKVSLKNDVSLDLGGIAKGKIIGEIAKYLKKNGIKDFLINGGGDIVIGGKYAGERKWKIAIADPFKKDDIMGIIELSDCTIVTSGDYERNFIGNDNKLYHHIIDPETGFPVDNEMHSVTVITAEPAKADAFATALFVMGTDEGMQFVNNRDDLEAIFIKGSRWNEILLPSKNISMKKRTDGIWDFKLNK